MSGSVALSGRERVRTDRPDYAAPTPPEPRRPLPVIAASALARPLTPAARERFEELGRERASGVWPPHLAELRERAAAIRRETLADLPGYLDRLTAALTTNGCTVHRVATTAEAREVVGRVAVSHGVRLATKVKSMASEEIHLNAHLAGLGVDVVETDLGEYMAQLFDERPSHIVGPILHRSQREAMDLFGQLTGEPLTDPQQIGPLARDRLRADFRASTLGICGVNFAAADTGTLVVVTNEGNADVITSQSEVLVAIMPVEKVIPRLADIGVLVPLLSEVATSYRLTAYQTLLAGPRRPGEGDGPRELHVVIYDNGRTRWLGTPEAEALACIRCGNCQFSCPVYRTLGGGHAYGSVYGGPIGAVLSPLLEDAGPRDADLPFLSSLCGACADACPVMIPLPDLLVRGRERYVREHPAPVERAVWRAWSAAWSSSAAYRAMRRGAGVVGRRGPASLLGRLPLLRSTWARGRAVPSLGDAGGLRRRRARRRA